ncbi:glycosyltransferase family 2 protein [Ferruginibacter paludis]|uniref:glycosyltransferase family 2 protein n=1 Tax=Ferruginibacter paludis TaxID=1310417 RepID=UPI0025B612BE|nr:glycosyltransferase family 2 protein [Ferruginibacter paludis]MDN3657697.1 glycosyltransferase family 2 protein [Ferruginibacter paludis]
MNINQSETQNHVNSEFPLVSIVMATYNGNKYLAQQMESIVAQSYPNIEVIIVDDRSTDDTVEILQRFQQQYSFLKIIRNEVNLGYIKNFEKGCLLANGELIALCDQDDYWHSDKIKNMQAAIGNYPLIYCDSILCDEHLKPLGVNISDRVNSIDFNSCLQQVVFCRIYGHATLMTKFFLQQAVPFLEVIPHDWWLCYRATFYGGIKYLPEQLVSYRQHAANIFGVVGSKSRKHNKINKAERNRLEMSRIRTRMNAFYNACPDALVKEKAVLKKLVKTYQNFSLVNNFQRMMLFFKYQDQFLASKKRSAIRRYLFCLKMFVIIK